MDKRLLSFLFLVLFLPESGSQAQSINDIEFFKSRSFGKYFISDIFSPNTSSTLGGGLLRSAFNINPERQANFALHSETTIGVQLPVLIWDIDGIMPSRLSVSLPVSVNLLLDLSEPLTHPVINTDYRLGAMEINYLYELGWGFVKNASIKFIPYYHESSHLGDELTIYRKDANFPITRINATNNTAEIALTINDENGSLETNHSFKIGTRVLYNMKNGFYRIRPEEGDPEKIIPSTNRFEWYGQYQWLGPSGVIKNEKVSTIFSVELRNRVRYNYPYYVFDPKTSKITSEVTPEQKFVPSVNGYVGWRYKVKENSNRYFGLYLRYYLGINPYGQFRNIPVHRYYGVSMIYEN